MNTVIVSIFPGMGKTYIKESNNFKIKDINSVEYAYLEDSKKGRLDNPDFPGNYIKAITEAVNSKEYDFVFVSSNSVVREALNKAKIQYVLISPKQSIKNELCERFKERGNSQRFIDKMYNNWNNYTNSIVNETYPLQIKFDINDSIDNDLLTRLKENLEGILSRTLNNVSAKNIEKDLGKYDILWTMISKNRKGWTSQELRKYKDFIDWDVLCKFNVIPEDILKDKSFEKYINMKYVKDNIKKYGLKVRKLIK